MNNYQKVLEDIKTMPHFKGMRIVVLEGSPGVYYPDYVPVRTMGMNLCSFPSREMEEKEYLKFRVRNSHYIDDNKLVSKLKSNGVPPEGRTKEQHNIIMSLNKRKY